ncbi:unnamed protein product [Schistosoma margrebowiei]|uniref:Uncharacterized protein n=1 Tax=Schistosoma margrebowiei TaxID=48269 RepID=A0A183LFQ6_9TREM|nr:unnamed protein product [Schistosoma margrebowiei]
MVIGGSQQETLDPGLVLLGTRQQGVPVILRELVLPGQQMQVMTNSVAAASQSVGLNMLKGRCKILKYSPEDTNLITLDGETF